MVAEPKPEPAPARSRGGLLRLPMWAMRLATSLTAAAFVITLSLSLFQQGLSPRAMTEQADTQPPPEVMKMEREVSSTEEVQALGVEEAAPAEATPEDALPTPTAQDTLTPREEMALEAMPGTSEGDQEGRGGGGDPPAPPEEEAKIMAEEVTEEAEAAEEAEAPADDAEAIPEDQEAEAAGPTPTPETGEPEVAIAQEAPAAPPEPTGDAEVPGPPPEPPVEAPEQLWEPRRWGWLAVITGALTAILGGLTLWMSRNRR
jgi:hypothetical protein